MVAVTYHVVIDFPRSKDGDVAVMERKEARSSDLAIRTAKRLAATEPRRGAIAFSRTGDPAVGDFEDAVILRKIAAVDEDFLRSRV